MKRKLVRIGIPVVVAVAAVGAFVLSGGSSKADSEYFTAPVTRGPVRRVVNATGTVQTVVTVQVGSQVSGQIQELYADFNSVVKRGQLLAKLDPRNLEAVVANSKASVAAAEARLRSAEADIKMHAANLQSSRANVDAARVTRDNARLQYDRAMELTQRGVASKNDYDTAKANFESAEARYQQAAASLQQVEAQTAATEAQVAQARAGLQQAEADLNRALINLEYADIFSPVDGVVISRDVDVGQTIAASMQAPTLFTIATDLSQMQVKASVDEADIGSISEDAEVSFTVDAYPNNVFRGKIAEIRLSPQTVQNVVTYNVILSIENRDMKLKPGMTANITIAVAHRDNVLKVPNAALRYNPPNAAQQPSTASSSGGAPPDGMRGQGRGRSSLAADRAPSTPSKPAAKTESVSLPQAPGQRWDPNEKVRFTTADAGPQRPGRIWVLGPDGKPQARMVMLGITDGAATEIVAGDISENDVVVVGDETQVDTTVQTPGRGGFVLGIGGGRGGRGGRGF